MNPELLTAISCYEDGKINDAIDILYKAIEKDPKDSELIWNLSQFLRFTGKIKEAIQYGFKAIGLNRISPSANYTLALALADDQQYEKALQYFQYAYMYSPYDAIINQQFGNFLVTIKAYADALKHFEIAHEINPDLPGINGNLAFIYYSFGQFKSAMQYIRAALEKEPNNPDEHLRLAALSLLTGNLKRGFQEYEWRWKTDQCPPREFQAPQWDGNNLQGKTILLYEVQGYGDLIHFSRYIAEILKQGAKVIIEVPEALYRLWKDYPKAQIIQQGESLPAFDCHAAFTSLPMFFKTTFENIPKPYPVMFHPSHNEKLELITNVNAFKVGICWRGDKQHKMDFRRSRHIKDFQNIFKVKNCQFFSFQVDTIDLEKDFMKSKKIIDLGHEFTDFADTACALQKMDLLISVDTAIVHLAGTFGIPTWLLLHYVPDWRWLLKCTNNPWYPSLRIYRQPELDDWKSVFEVVYKELINLPKEQ